jgi:hypothetical protein
LLDDAEVVNNHPMTPVNNGVDNKWRYGGGARPLGAGDTAAVAQIRFRR